MLCGGAGTSPHPPAPIQRTSAPACPAGPGAHPTIATHYGDVEGGARPAAGAGAGGDPGSGPEAAQTYKTTRPLSPPAARKGRATARRDFYSADGGPRGPTRARPEFSAAAAPSSGPSRLHRARGASGPRPSSPAGPPGLTYRVHGPFPSQPLPAVRKSRLPARAYGPDPWPAGRHQSASAKHLEQGQAQRHLITSPVVTAPTPRASLKLGPPLCSLQKGLPLSGEPWLSCCPCRSPPGAPAPQAGSEALLKTSPFLQLGNSAFPRSGGVSWVPPLTRGRGCQGALGSDTFPPLTGRPLRWGQEGPAMNSLVP